MRLRPCRVLNQALIGYSRNLDAIATVYQLADSLPDITQMNRSTDNQSLRHSPWMSWVLWAAAIYNLLWGAWVVLFPGALFDFAGIPRPVYIGIWQCVGMVIGVYGIGYGIAATDPFRHWPIVLVGFLGKILGPIGMVWTWITMSPDTAGFLPPRFAAATNITNDLIWWIPFGMILYGVFKHANRPADSKAISVPDANCTFQSQHGNTIAELSSSKELLLVFLRHSGCIFCREALADLKDCREQIESSGATLAIVHMSDNADAEDFFASYDMQSVDRFSDPECQLYQAYALHRGSFAELFGIRNWWVGFKAMFVGRHGIGKLVGDGFQMPGAFIVADGKVVKAYRHTGSGDRPDYVQLVQT